MPRRVYAQSNSQNENEVLGWESCEDGTLIPCGTWRTGGRGTGAELGSQGSLAVSDDERFVYVVNAGSNDISAFATVPGGLRLLGVVNSGGVGPVCLAARDTRLYVANAFGHGCLTTFCTEHDGVPEFKGRAPLSADGATPAHIALVPDALIVSELVTERLVTMRLGGDGQPMSQTHVTAAGQGPLGIALASGGRLIVAESFREAPGAGAVSSYELSAERAPMVVSASVPTHQTGASGVAASADGRHVYVSNAGSGSISGFSSDANGRLSGGRTVSTGIMSRPQDLVASDDGYLYVLAIGTRTIAVFTIAANGDLRPLASAGGVPAAAAGLVMI